MQTVRNFLTSDGANAVTSGQQFCPYLTSLAPLSGEKQGILDSLEGCKENTQDRNGYECASFTMNSKNIRWQKDAGSTVAILFAENYTRRRDLNANRNLDIVYLSPLGAEVAQVFMGT
jgi:hypothetical protein